MISKSFEDEFYILCICLITSNIVYTNMLKCGLNKGGRLYLFLETMLSVGTCLRINNDCCVINSIVVSHVIVYM